MSRTHAEAGRWAALSAALAVLFLAGGTAQPGSARAAAAPEVTVNFQAHGISLSGLQVRLPGGSAAHEPQIGISAPSLSTMRDQIRAARRYWHANTIRLQVQQDKLVGRYGNRFSPAYMADIRSLVSYAKRLGLAVVLSCTTLPVPAFPANEPLPTYATEVFWRRMNAYYRNDHWVIYDLFNEPRTYSWARWHRAFQQTLNDARKDGSHNVIWIDSIRSGNTMRGLWPYRLDGTGLVYSFHHPIGPHTTASWYRNFRYLQPRGLHLVNGEFSNWAGGYCWEDAPAKIPVYLRYLQEHHIGMTAWTLQKGVLNSTGGYASATRMGAGFTCHAGRIDQGAGMLIKDWMRSLSAPAGHGHRR